jgi:hypothetical protein
MIILLTGGLLYNTYHDNFIVNSIKTHLKYYKMAGILVFGIGFYLMIQRNPNESLSFMDAFRQYIQVMPMDRQTKDMIQPFLQKDPAERIRTSGKNATSRSVSETKKKYVASQQGWKCKKCQQPLTAWFEVDHDKRLEHGGTNELDNLSALCRNCHGENKSRNKRHKIRKKYQKKKLFLMSLHYLYYDNLLITYYKYFLIIDYVKN